VSWDDFGDVLPDFDLSTFLQDYDFGGTFGDIFFDTDTGTFLDASQVDPSMVMDLDMSGSGSGPVGEVFGPQNYDWDAAAAGETGAGYATPEQVAATAPFNASSGSDWGKALAQGLSKALGGLGGGLSSLGSPGAGGGGGLVGGTPMPAMMSGAGGGGGGGGISVPGLQGPVDVPGLQGLVRPGMQEALGGATGMPRGLGDVGASLGGAPQFSAAQAAFAQLSPEQRAALGMQAPIDRGPDPVKFTPLQMPVPGGAMPMAGAAPAPRLSGLQRLALERLG